MDPWTRTVFSNPLKRLESPDFMSKLERTYVVRVVSRGLGKPAEYLSQKIVDP